MKEETIFYLVTIIKTSFTSKGGDNDNFFQKQPKVTFQNNQKSDFFLPFKFYFFKKTTKPLNQIFKIKNDQTNEPQYSRPIS